MLLKSIEYFNFRPFIGEQRINLDYDENNKDANVIVILGDNTYGKSTFVLSFIWCFYGVSKFTRPNDILNKKIESEMFPGDTNKASVKVEFEDDGKIYTMKRVQRFTMLDSGNLRADESNAELTYFENNEVKSVGKMQNEINLAIRSILPLDLSSFFFFEGEKNNEITKKDLSSAVKTLIGLEAYDNMRKHLHGPNTQAEPTNASVMGQYLSKQSEESGSEAQKAFEKKTNAEDELQQVIERIDEINDEIRHYEEETERINQQLRDAGPSKALQQRRDQIAVEIKTNTDLEKKKSKEFLRRFSEDSLSLLLTPFFAKTNVKLTEMDVNDKGIKGIEATAIRELLHRGECLCGTDLKEGSLAYKNVEKYIDYVPPKSIGVLVRDMQEKIDEFEGKNTSFVNEIENLYSEIISLRVKIDDLEREDRSILGDIADIGEVDTADAEQNLSIYRKRLSDLKDELLVKTTRKGSLQSEIETATHNFNMYKDRNQKAKRFQLYYRYAEAIYNWVQKNYEIKEEEVRRRLNIHVQELFNKMYSGHRDISIDEKYNIVLTYEGKNVDDTGGLRVIQYFAYVGALVRTAYEVMLEREKDDGGNQEMLGEQYPLVLDAAFSHADSTHTKNIASELANAANQLVFAVMEKDWQHAKVGLEGHVIRKYELVKISETEVKIKEA